MNRKPLRAIRKLFFSDNLWGKIRALPHYRLVQGPFTYNQDGLASWHNCDFIHDPKFERAYKLGRETRSWQGVDIHWRAYIACWAAMKGLSLDGDFVECGTNRGGLSRMIIDYTNFDKLPRHFFLLDTFCGLVEEQISEEEKLSGKLPGGYTECYEDVKKTFGPFPNVTLIRGTVPHTLTQITAKRIAYLSLDMNCAPPEIAAAEFLWDRLVSGAVIVLDDYGWPGYIAQKKAFDRFAAEHHVQVLPLPTGQGLIFKP